MSTQDMLTGMSMAILHAAVTMSIAAGLAWTKVVRPSVGRLSIYRGASESRCAPQIHRLIYSRIAMSLPEATEVLIIGAGPTGEPEKSIISSKFL